MPAKKNATGKTKTSPAKKASTSKTSARKTPTAKTKPKAAAQTVESTIAPPVRKSAFHDLGFQATIELLKKEVRELYLSDDVPWIIGYSGGKDSTAVLQLVWQAMVEMEAGQHHKPIHVISTDTLVENPVVAAWVANSLRVMKEAADSQGLPIQPHRLTPKVVDSFWVNLIGKGYPAPRHKFRWCTERLKIRPSNGFINSVILNHGQVILALGTRKAESSARSANMTAHEKLRVKDRLSPNGSIPGSLVFTPIETWSNDDVWMYLTQVQNPWGYNNAELLGMYAGATEDGECPLVVDTSTPSCGDSRFGCWVCTLVEKDKSMTAMIQNDAEKEWMQPLLDLRNLIDFREDGQVKDPATGELKDVHTKREAFSSDVGRPLADFLEEQSGKAVDELIRERDWERHLRDFRRMTGNVQLMANGRYVPGPYLQQAREAWLRALLKAQVIVREIGPTDVADLELITLEELQEIRRIWVVEKHELEDRLPGIYEDVTGQRYPGRRLDDSLELSAVDLELLEDLCAGDRMHYELTRSLIGLARDQKTRQARSGYYGEMEKAFRRHYYDGVDDATSLAREKSAKRNSHLESRVAEGPEEPLL